MDSLIPGGIPAELMPAGPANEQWGHPDFAEAMRGEIWRYHKQTEKWELAHRSDLWELKVDLTVQMPGGGTVTIPKGIYPKAYGYRDIKSFNGYEYALGIGMWMPPLPFTNVMRSASGDKGTWEDVTGSLGFGQGKLNTNNPRSMVVFQDRLHLTAAVPGSVQGEGGMVFATKDPVKEDWTLVSLPGLGNEENAEVVYLEVFNNCLYASTMNNDTGFEVHKTDGTIDPDDPDGKRYLWKCVIKDGFGDTWNQACISMQGFGDHLYIGTAVAVGLVFKNGEPVGTKPCEVIRIDKNDDAELLVGSPIASDPAPGWPMQRTPLSGWPAGFGNFGNVYVWHLEVHDNMLYLATFDATGPIIHGLSSLLSAGLLDVKSLSKSLEELVDAMDKVPYLKPYAPFVNYMLYLLEVIPIEDFLFLLLPHLGGADLWETPDGINWTPVTLNGFDNGLNYGFRRMLSCGDYLVLGTANPYTGEPNGGCEVIAVEITD